MPKKESFKVKFPETVGKIREETIKVVIEGYYLFFNCQHLIIKLKPLARSFFDYLCERMRSDNNEILINNALKSDFKTHISTSSGNKHNPSIAALGKHLKAFKELRLVILSSNAKKQFYIVNPKYAYNKGAKRAG
jgi:hypothetical protein